MRRFPGKDPERVVCEREHRLRASHCISRTRSGEDRERKIVCSESGRVLAFFEVIEALRISGNRQMSENNVDRIIPFLM